MATSWRSRFQHTPLESPERQIRLLSVLPSQDDNQAHYKLDTYILGGHRTPHFYAISYEWGPKKPLHEIIIDDKVFMIRTNLKDCLERFGSAYEGFYRPVWIDAICIDQDKVAERNAQVKMMGEIYSSAKLVLAWFGKQAPVNGTLTKTLSCLQQWQVSPEFKTLVNNSTRQNGSAPRLQRTSPPELLSLADPYGPMWSCLRNLCDQTYWSRLWIVQELVKAQKLLLLWGDEQIPWNVLSAAFRTIQLNNLYIRTSEARYAPWDAIALTIPYQVWLQRDGVRPERSLLDLMETYRSSDCSLAHDKAYALTGISTDSSQLQVDYEKSLPDLYVDLMQLVAHKSRCVKYSHLIHGALRLNSDHLLTGPGATSLRGHNISCDAQMDGRIEATKAVDFKVPSINVEAEIFELLLMASAILSDEVISSLSHWAQHIHKALQRKFRETHSEVIFFWLSSNRLGAALATVPVGHSVCRLPGVNDPTQDFFVRVDYAADSGDGPASPDVGIESPLMSSPTQSHSTFFSDAGVELGTRVWVSDIKVPQALGQTNAEASSVELVSVQISLSDLVAMESLIDVDLKEAEDAVSPLRKSSQDAHTEAIRRRNTFGSVSISDAIDEVMELPSKTRAKSSTWLTATPAHSQIYIDALSRDLRDSLFKSKDSSLNSPE